MTHTGTGPDTAETLKTLSALNARFIHNYVTNDVAAHDAILHPDFVCISSSGKRIGRAAYLERWATLFDPAIVTYWDTRDEVITLNGNVALVRATNKHAERNNGTIEIGMTCYTDTYVLEDGKWLCLQAQLTSVSPEHWPPDDTIISVYVNGKRRADPAIFR